MKIPDFRKISFFMVFFDPIFVGHDRPTIRPGDISYSGTGMRMLNNYGLLYKSGAGQVLSYTTTTNSGTIEAAAGTLNFVDPLGLTNTKDGIVKGTGTIDIPAMANFANDGIFAPGASPGILKVLGDFKSTPSSILDIEINGTDQGVDYDLLKIQGSATIGGKVKVTLGFDAQKGDEFIIATTTGEISQCTLQKTATATFDGHDYTFDVFRREGNKVVLKINTRTLRIDDNALSGVSVYPNPSLGTFHINLGRAYDRVTFTVTDILGKQVSNREYSNLNKIDQEMNAPAGLYFMNIKTSEGASKTVKLIKK